MWSYFLKSALYSTALCCSSTSILLPYMDTTFLMRLQVRKQKQTAKIPAMKYTHKMANHVIMCVPYDCIGLKHFRITLVFKVNWQCPQHLASGLDLEEVRKTWHLLYTAETGRQLHDGSQGVTAGNRGGEVWDEEAFQHIQNLIFCNLW